MPTYPTTPALRAFFDHQISFATELMRHSCESVRKLSGLHFQLMQLLMEDSFNTGRQLLACTDALQLPAASLSQLEPITEHLHNYQEQLMKVMAGVQVDLARTAGQLMPEAGRSASAAAEELARRTAEATQAFARATSGNGAYHAQH